MSCYSKPTKKEEEVNQNVPAFVDPVGSVDCVAN